MKTNENNFDAPPGPLKSKLDRPNILSPGPNSDGTWLSAVSQLASSLFIPLMIPAATAFVGWYANRKYAAKLRQDEALQDELSKIRIDIRDAQKQGGPYVIEDEGRNADIIQEEERTMQNIHKDLENISKGLETRQNIYCSPFTWRTNRHQIEEHLKDFAFNRTYDKDLKLYRGLSEIFRYDNHCESYGSHRNGCMMWVYMDMWRNMARLRKYQRIEERIQSGKSE